LINSLNVGGLLKSWPCGGQIAERGTHRRSLLAAGPRTFALALLSAWPAAQTGMRTVLKTSDGSDEARDKQGRVGGTGGRSLNRTKHPRWGSFALRWRHP